MANNSIYFLNTDEEIKCPWEKDPSYDDYGLYD